MFLWKKFMLRVGEVASWGKNCYPLLYVSFYPQFRLFQVSLLEKCTLPEENISRILEIPSNLSPQIKTSLEMILNLLE